MKDFFIAVDFDGTIVEHEFPKIGARVDGAIEWMKKFIEAKAKLILWTVRNDGRDPPYDNVLTNAIGFCQDYGIEFFGINNNPTQYSWSQSAKVYAHVYIDDAAFGCPLLHWEDENKRPVVNWSIVGPRVMRMIHEYQGNS